MREAREPVSIGFDVDPTSIVVTEAGLASGRLVLWVGGVPFPDEGWSDSVVVVLAWAVGALARVLDGGRSDFEFMEGPYVVELEGGPGGDSVAVRCVEQRKTRRTVVEASVQAEELVASIIEAGSAVLEAFSHEPDDEGRNGLRAGLGRLKQSREP